MMTTKELIMAEIDNVSEEHLDELYDAIKTFVQSKENGSKQGFMAGLKRVKIDAPEDFAANFDLYASGEKRAERVFKNSFSISAWLASVSSDV